jgi:hypothetical protein
MRENRDGKLQGEMYKVSKIAVEKNLLSLSPRG